MGEAGLVTAWEGNVTSPGIPFVNGINLGLTDKKEVLIIIIWYILTSKERRTIMIAKALETNNLTANDRERVVLLAAY